VGFCGGFGVAVYQGTNALALDAKGRMTVPQRYRDALDAQCGGALTLIKHQDGCLQLLPRALWEAFRDKLLGLSMKAYGIRRLYVGSALDVELDSAGRILISPELREYANITRDVLLIGVGKNFEIWDARTHADREAQLLAAASAGELDLPADLSF